MIIGIDGNQWYCSNGLCLGDPRAEFSFGDTLGDAIDKFHNDFKNNDSYPDELKIYLDKKPEEYKKIEMFK